VISRQSRSISRWQTSFRKKIQLGIELVFRDVDSHDRGRMQHRLQARRRHHQINGIMFDDVRKVYKVSPTRPNIACGSSCCCVETDEPADAARWRCRDEYRSCPFATAWRQGHADRGRSRQRHRASVDGPSAERRACRLRRRVEFNRKQCRELAHLDLPAEIDWSMFEGLDFDAMAKQPRKMGRPKRTPD
jgi:hypothetical protein